MSKHFEKIICGFAGLMFLAAIVYSVSRNAADELESVLANIRSSMRVLEEEQEERPDIDIAALEELEQLWEKARSVSRSYEFTEAFWPSFPKFYDPYMAGLENEYILDFDDPLEIGSVSVAIDDGRDILDEEYVEHPVEGDLSRVRIRTGAGQGVARVIGQGGGRIHVRVVETDEDVYGRPHPPLEVASSAERNVVNLYFEPHPDNRREVVVQGYEIHRRRASDLGGEFEPVGRVGVSRAELTDEAIRELTEYRRDPRDQRQVRDPRQRQQPPMEPSPRDRELQDPRFRQDRPTDDDPVYQWRDEDVEPGEIYLYKVRTVGLRSSPRESEFTDMHAVEAMPIVDFRYTGESAGEVRFQVAVAFDPRFPEIREKLGDGRELQRDFFRQARAEEGFSIQDLNHHIGDHIGEVIVVERERRQDPMDRRRMYDDPEMYGPDMSRYDQEMRREVGMEEEELEDIILSTDSILLDHHPEAIQRRPFFARRRIVFVDRKGEIQSRWRNRWGTGEDGDYPWEPQIERRRSPYQR